MSAAIFASISAFACGVCATTALWSDESKGLFACLALMNLVFVVLNVMRA